MKEFNFLPIEEQQRLVDMKDVKRKYWYKFEIEECVLCGAGREIKYRVYEKPSIEEKYKFTEFACEYHFM